MLPPRIQSLFVERLLEVFDPLHSPRYILRLREWVAAVPKAYANNKTSATQFAKIWNRRVGRSMLLYTRSEEGRLELLRAKERALLGTSNTGIERRVQWM